MAEDRQAVRFCRVNDRARVLRREIPELDPVDTDVSQLTDQRGQVAGMVAGDVLRIGPAGDVRRGASTSPRSIRSRRSTSSRS
jgi:hypothetical protein